MPTPVAPASTQPPTWLDREKMDALDFFNGRMQIQDNNRAQMHRSLTDLFNEDPHAYYAMVIARTDEIRIREKQLHRFGF